MTGLRALRGWGPLPGGGLLNPVLPGDYSDPDVIRVGDDYWMITSTFQYAPGMAVLHSRDLISWEHVGGCVPDMSVLGPEYRWDRMARYNRGIYAGSLRHHDGLYWLHFTTLDEGIFVTTAEYPGGPWQPPRLLSDQTMWDDPCPLWDGDGRAWLVASRPGPSDWFTYLIPMHPDGSAIDLGATTVLDGQHTSEGNKIYRVGRGYFLLHNEVRGSGDRVLVVMRAAEITGPWVKRVLLQGGGPDREREPNQGALVDHADGSWSLVTHHGRGGYADGRPVSVLPVEWADGWPVVVGPDGHRGGGDRPGLMSWRGRAPVPGATACDLHLDDDFTGGALGAEWEWNHQPRPDSWSLAGGAGGLLLRASRPLEPANSDTPAIEQDPSSPCGLWDLNRVPSVVTRRLLGTAGATATVRLATDELAIGQQAGVGVLCRDSSWIAVTRSGVALEVATGGGEAADGPTIATGVVWLRVTVDERGYVTYEYSRDGVDFVPVGNSDRVSSANYRGARLALFSVAEFDDAGTARFEAWRYEVAPRLWIPS